MSENLKRIGRTLKYEGAIVKVYTDEIQLPDGKVAEWDFINHDGAAAVVPVRDDGKILMVRQYRNALDSYTLEIPAGKLDSKEEETLVCAKRNWKKKRDIKQKIWNFCSHSAHGWRLPMRKSMCMLLRI